MVKSSSQRLLIKQKKILKRQKAQIKNLSIQLRDQSNKGIKKRIFNKFLNGLTFRLLFQVELSSCRLSSAVEQRFCKAKVISSNLLAGIFKTLFKNLANQLYLELSEIIQIKKAGTTKLKNLNSIIQSRLIIGNLKSHQKKDCNNKTIPKR